MSIARARARRPCRAACDRLRARACLHARRSGRFLGAAAAVVGGGADDLHRADERAADVRGEHDPVRRVEPRCCRMPFLRRTHARQRRSEAERHSRRVRVEQQLRERVGLALDVGRLQLRDDDPVALAQTTGGGVPSALAAAPDPSRTPRRRGGTPSGRTRARPRAGRGSRRRRPSRGCTRRAPRPSARPPASSVARREPVAAPDARRRRTRPSP